MSIADFPYRPARAAWGANRLVDVGGAGLAVPDTGSGNAFSRNRVSRCAGPGILLRGHMNRLERDPVAKGGGDGLVLGGSGGHVATRVKLAKVTGDGAAVTAGRTSSKA